MKARSINNDASGGLRAVPNMNSEPVRFRRRFDEMALLSEMSIACLTRIAENSSIPPTLLEQLALHPHAAVREAVADNCATPVDSLWLLAYDNSSDVRYAMAENHNLPLAILSALTEDDNPYVAYRAASTISRVTACGDLLPFGFAASEQEAG